VKKFSQRASLPWRTLSKRIETLATGLLVATSLAAIGMPSSAVGQVEGSDSEQTQALADGVYLYGQSPEPGTMGSEYLVFEVSQGEVVGGFYMPRSSFDCFYGDVESEQLALTVVNSYEQTQHPYSVALQTDGAVASAENGSAPMGLEGYHRLDNLSDTDQQILATCKADHNR
jgi:hypothetical protein